QEQRPTAASLQRRHKAFQGSQDLLALPQLPATHHGHTPTVRNLPHQEEPYDQESTGIAHDIRGCCPPEVLSTSTRTPRVSRFISGHRGPGPAQKLPSITNQHPHNRLLLVEQAFCADGMVRPAPGRGRGEYVC